MKTRNILCAFLTLIAVGCIKENEMTSGDNTPAGSNTITVNMPGLTRTAIGDETQTGVSLVWSKGDQIAIIEGKGTDNQKHSVYELVGEGGTASGTFEYVSGEASAEIITDVVFPASAVENDYAVPTLQTYVEGSFDTDAMVMSWTLTSGDEEITLKHEAAALMFTVTGTAEQKISSVAVKCGENTYTLTCDEPVALSSEGTVFYVAVPGSETSQHYEVTFTAEGDKTLTKEFDHALNAGKIGRLPEFAFETTPAVEPLKLGDYFGGGIVFQLTDEYAKIVSLDEGNYKWATKTDYMQTDANAAEGIANTDLFRNRTDLDDFPAVKWCIEHGDGWYMPSRSEMNAIIDGLGIKTEETMNTVNQKFVEYGGTGFTTAYYLTSCESATETGKVWTVPTPTKAQGHTAYNKNTSERPVRAVKKITLTGGETADPKPESQVIMLYSTKDAYFTYSKSTTNSGVSEYIQILFNTDGAWNRIGYLQFDISELSLSTFDSAVLNCTIDSQNSKFVTDPATFNLYSVSNDWEESEKTTEKANGTYVKDSSPIINSVQLSSSDTKMTVDISSAIKPCLENGEKYISICIESIGSNNSATDKTDLRLYSRESTIEGTQPYLEVTTRE